MIRFNRIMVMSDLFMMFWLQTMKLCSQRIAISNYGIASMFDNEKLKKRPSILAVMS